VKVGSGASSNWNINNQPGDKGWKAPQLTFNGLGTDRKDIDVEVIGEYGNTLWSGVRRSRVKERGEAVPYGESILVCQSSMSPVAPEWTIDDDSNGSIARDRFNLPVYC